eukprot:scaffold2750_cov67-Cylindrotheca_fusiformis.AAC.1
MTHLRVDSSVREIPDQAFAYCEALEHVQLPMTLTRIGARAFNTCGYLKFVQFLVSSNDSHLETFSSGIWKQERLCFQKGKSYYRLTSLHFLGAIVYGRSLFVPIPRNLAIQHSTIAVVWFTLSYLRGFKRSNK